MVINEIVLERQVLLMSKQEELNIGGESEVLKVKCKICKQWFNLLLEDVKQVLYFIKIIEVNNIKNL